MPNVYRTTVVVLIELYTCPLPYTLVRVHDTDCVAQAAVSHRTTRAICGQELHSVPHVLREIEHADEHPPVAWLDTQHTAQAAVQYDRIAQQTLSITIAIARAGVLGTQSRHGANHATRFATCQNQKNASHGGIITLSPRMRPGIGDAVALVR